jgi:hypothetical protein
MQGIQYITSKAFSIKVMWDAVPSRLVCVPDTSKECSAFIFMG